MIWLLIPLVVAAAVFGAVLCLSAQRSHQAFIARRAERARIERQTRWAERRLYDIAQQGFTALTDEARRARGDAPRSA
jgi:hypothetical protein